VRRLGSAAVLLGAAALRGTVATAQVSATEPSGPWQLSLFGGGWNAIGTTYLHRTPSGNDEVGFGNAPAFGVSAGLDVSRLAGLELSWMQSNPTQQAAGSPPTTIRTVRLDVFELDSLWYFGRGGFQPYGIVGVGGASTGSSFGGTNFTAVAGVGVKAFLGRHWAIRADVRAAATYGNVGHPGAPAFCDAAGCYFYRSSWTWSLPVTAGLTYAF
jgi:Outer membrane protein beta-barrel domain